MTSTVKRGEKWVNESAKTALKNLESWEQQATQQSIDKVRAKMIEKHSKSWLRYFMKLDTSDDAVKQHIYDSWDFCLYSIEWRHSKACDVLYRLAASTDCLVQDNYCMLSLEDSAILEKWLNWVPE